jgi:hypothetical protein
MFTQQAQVVIATYRESDEWALVIYAYRTGSGSRGINPVVFVEQTSLIYAMMPLRIHRYIQVLPSANVKEALRVELLKAAVSDTVKTLSRDYRLLEQASPGILRNIQARSFTDALVGFEMGVDLPALEWLCESRWSDNAMATLRLVRCLADKHNLGVPTQSQRENTAMNQILGGYSGKRIS